MNGAVLAIGDELICGYQLDTNSQEVSQQLALVPVDVVLHVSVGDDPAHIQAALRMALGMVDVLVVTGGLGPTEDDLTRQVIAAHFGRELIEDPEALERIREEVADLTVAATERVGFPVGHASAQLGWRGLLSRPTWRILVYSAENPPKQRGLVLVDGVDGRIVSWFSEDNPEDWSDLDGALHDSA